MCIKFLTKEEVEESWRHAVKADSIVKIINLQGGATAYLVSMTAPPQDPKTLKELQDIINSFAAGIYNVAPASLVPCQQLQIETLALPDVETIYSDPPAAPVCECGAEKCGSPSHSSWCPIFKKDDP